MGNIKKYKMINAEMSKTIATLKRDVTRLKDENAKVTIESLRVQNQNIKLKKQIADSQKMQVDHVNALTMELQSFVSKMNKIVVSKNERNQIGEQSSMNVSANNSEGSRRLSRSHESPVQRRRSASKNYEEENGLHTIMEETQQNNEADTTENTTKSIITSQCQSTIKNFNSIKNSLLDPDASTEASTSIQSDVISIASNSIDSNKENQSSQSSKELKQTEYFGDLSPLKNVMIDLVANRRRKQNVINHSGMVSSTPYKRIVNETNTGQSISTVLSESDVSEAETEATHVANTRSKRIRKTTKSISALSSESTTIRVENKDAEILPSKRTENTGKIFSNISNGSTRPKRKASPAKTLIEPKLNTKLRRPLSMEPKVTAKPKCKNE